MPERTLEDVVQNNARVRRIIIALLVIGSLLLVLALAAAGLAAKRSSDDTRAVEHTLSVRATIYRVGNFAERVETARRGYFISGDRRFADGARRSHVLMRQELAHLDRLVADNPVQRQQTASIARLSDRKWAMVAGLFADRNAFMDRERATALYDDQTVALVRSIRRTLEAMDAREVTLLDQRSGAQKQSLRLFALFGMACAIALVLVVLGAAILFARYNRDLTGAQARLRAANEGLEDAVASRTVELSRANDEIQRFAYIVSHDLRSPLVNVLGFTAELDAARKTLHGFVTKLFEEHPELRDEDAWLAVEEDLPEALGFIRTSTERMDRLINSILELSRQGRRTLAPELLDMDHLVEGVAASMKQRADAAGATVTLSPLPQLTSDRMAVEQILSNLIENSLKYLSPARAGEVRVEGHKKGRWVEIAVIDNGRGIAPADHQRIFDLFRRAGTQDQSGEGIGLANVRALAYRLGGRIGVESQLDQGARFTLTLPETFTVAEPN